MAGLNAGLSACGRRQQWERVQLQLVGMAADAVSFGVLLRSCREAQVDRLRPILLAMRRRGVRLSLEALDGVVGACATGRR